MFSQLKIYCVLQTHRCCCCCWMRGVDTLTIMSSSTFYDLKGFYGSLGNETCSICERAHKPSVQVKMRNLTKWKMKIWIFNVRPEPSRRKSMKIKICFSLRHLNRVRLDAWMQRREKLPHGTGVFFFPSKGIHCWPLLKMFLRSILKTTKSSPRQRDLCGHCLEFCVPTCLRL